MKRALIILLFIALSTCAQAQDTPPPMQLNDPSQNPLGATAVISSGLSDALDTDVRLVLTLANPSQSAVTFNLVETLFIAGTQQGGQPLFPDRMVPDAVGPGQTAELHFRYDNTACNPQVSAYVLIDFLLDGQRQRTALFIPGPVQQSLGNRWQQTFFPYGHVSGLYADPWDPFYW